MEGEKMGTDQKQIIHYLSPPKTISGSSRLGLSQEEKMKTTKAKEWQEFLEKYVLVRW